MKKGLKEMMKFANGECEISNSALLCLLGTTLGLAFINNSKEMKLEKMRRQLIKKDTEIITLKFENIVAKACIESMDDKTKEDAEK